MAYPQDRLRRLRATAGLRRMVRETRLSVDNLIAPIFIVEGRDVRQPIASMPGQWRVSVDHLIKDAGEGHALGVPAVLLFGIPARKDEIGSAAWGPDGIVPRRGDTAGSRRRGLLPCADPLVCRQVCLLPVCAVPGGGGLQPEVWGPPVLSDGSSQPA